MRVAAIVLRLFITTTPGTKKHGVRRAVLGCQCMSAPLISVIVVNWNGLGLLDECFDSLARQTWPETEFILVDNGSTDGSRDLLAAWAQRLPNGQAILLPTNPGLRKGNNIGFGRP